MRLKLLSVIFALSSTIAQAQTFTIPIHEATPQGQGHLLGTINIEETAYGLLFSPHLKGLTAGIYGFHIHENPNCNAQEKDGEFVPALAAGGHWDPQKTGQHLGPYHAGGHLGDLPALVASENGIAEYPILAPKLKSLQAIKGHALMIHVGGDNYSDHPSALGGGGARMACGIIQ